jgi:glucose/arabinose dehydrogenase
MGEMKKFGLILVAVLAASVFYSCGAPAQTTPAASGTAPPAIASQTPAASRTSPPPAPETESPDALGPLSVQLELAEAYPDLTFEKPLYFSVAEDESGLAYVVEQTGKILVFEDRADATEASVFLDLSDRIDTGGTEKGLLGLAFHPDYKNNGYLYVDYTDEEGSVIARYTRRAENPMEADPESEQILLTFDQPYENHNGGQLNFGPDGYLYIGTGDGGSGGDPQNNAQNLASYLGKILRIDVDSPAGGRAYAVPADNPFAGNEQGQLEEIYAYGLRNPWRFSFDGDGTLWVADVGQDAMEEIDQVQNGGNYGWSIMEGTLDYKDIPGVDKSALIPPVWEYGHDQGESITGGYVYEGGQIPDLAGRYIYGDFVSGRIWALWADENGQMQNRELLASDLNIASFGLDAEGEIRIVDLSGRIYRLKEAGT